MNKLFIGLVSFLFVIAFTSVGFTHPPEAIIYKYYPDTKILSLGIAHDVKNPKTHFIKFVSIQLNGKELLQQNFLSQTNKDAQAISYMVVDLKKGDVLDILAVCNMSGELKKTVKIE